MLFLTFFLTRESERFQVENASHHFSRFFLSLRMLIPPACGRQPRRIRPANPMTSGHLFRWTSDQSARSIRAEPGTSKVTIKRIFSAVKRQVELVAKISSAEGAVGERSATDFRSPRGGTGHAVQFCKNCAQVYPVLRRQWSRPRKRRAIRRRAVAP